MKPEQLKNYAKLIVKTGINIQKDQMLVISSPIECAYFARLMMSEAYELGASEVIINWGDELSTKIMYDKAPDKLFDELPSYLKELYTSATRKGAGFISISAADPELLKDVDPNRVARFQKARKIGLTEFYEATMAHRNSWCVVSVPTTTWAKKVFSDKSEDEAVALLWDAICKTVRADHADPIEAWNKHLANFSKNLEFLNSNAFRFLKYKASNGTDLTIELPEKHLWCGASDFTPEGIEFVANIPTEEIFTLPKKDGVNGIVYSSKPLVYNGNLIDEFHLVFENGRIIDYGAKKGLEILKQLLGTDEGSLYLGEVALVPYDSPINNTGILFYNTLFDENASCHLAFGKAYPTCLSGGVQMTKEELAANGANDSLTHEDFMVGTKDLSIIGIKADGTEVQIFKDGNFAN